MVFLQWVLIGSWHWICHHYPLSWYICIMGIMHHAGRCDGGVWAPDTCRHVSDTRYENAIRGGWGGVIWYDDSGTLRWQWHITHYTVSLYHYYIMIWYDSGSADSIYDGERACVRSCNADYWSGCVTTEKTQEKICTRGEGRQWWN